MGDSPTAAPFLYSLATSDSKVEVKPIDDSFVIVKADCAESLAQVTQRLTLQKLAWVTFEEYLVNTTE